MSWINKIPRVADFLLLAIVLLVVVALTAFHQLPVVFYKIALVTLAGVAGYWLDRTLFPYARPDGFLVTDWRLRRKELTEYGEPGAVDYAVIGGYQTVYAAAMLRRALIVLATILGVALGL